MKTTINDVAKTAGVAHSTVYMALQDNPKIAEKTRLKVQAIAKQLKFTPNGIARALATNKTQTFGVITATDIAGTFFTKIFDGIRVAADKQGYSVLFHSTDVTHRKDISAIQMLLAKRVDGLILIPYQKDIEDIKLLLETNFPFVFFNAHMFDDRTDYVICDMEKGANDITKHLIKLGHKQIAYIGYSSQPDRLIGYKKALADSGLPIKEELIYTPQKTEVIESLPRILSTILALKERPTAIFIADDEDAIRAINLLNKKGIKVPDAMAIVGFCNIDFSEICIPPLTTVDQFPYKIGKKSAELLIDKMTGKNQGVQHIVIEPKVVVRESCGAGLNRESYQP